MWCSVTKSSSSLSSGISRIQGPVLVDQEIVRGDRPAIERVALVDLRDGLLDLAIGAAILASEPSDDAPSRQPGLRVPDAPLIPGAPVQAIEDRSATDPRLRRNDERSEGHRRVHPDVVDLHQPARRLRGLGRWLAKPGLLPRAGRERYPRQRAGRQALARTAARATNQSSGPGVAQLQIGLRPVGAAMALLRVAPVAVGQVVPGHVGQIALFVNEDPGHLLEPAAAIAAVGKSSCAPGLASLAAATRPSPASPGRRMQQAATQAAHPGREPERRHPADHRTVALRRSGRCAERVFDAESTPHPIHVANLPSHGIAARPVPRTDVLHHHQAVRAAHDGADRTVAEQVREPNGNVLFSHGRSLS